MNDDIWIWLLLTLHLFPEKKEVEVKNKDTENSIIKYLQCQNQSIFDRLNPNHPIVFKNYDELSKFMNEQIEAEIERREESSHRASGKGW